MLLSKIESIAGELRIADVPSNNVTSSARRSSSAIEGDRYDVRQLEVCLCDFFECFECFECFLEFRYGLINILQLIQTKQP